MLYFRRYNGTTKNLIACSPNYHLRLPRSITGEMGKAFIKDAFLVMTLRST